MSKQTPKDTRYEVEISKKFDDIRKYIADGLSNNEVARKLRISWDTIKYYMKTYPEFDELFKQRPPKKPHKSDKYYTHIQPRLGEIEQWLKDRVPRGEITRRLEVGDTTMTRCKRIHPELNEIFLDDDKFNPGTKENSIDMEEKKPKLDDEILESLKLLAKGCFQDVIETIEEKQYSANNEYKGKRVKTIKRQLVVPPNIDAIKFLAEYQPRVQPVIAPPPSCSCDKKELEDVRDTISHIKETQEKTVETLQLLKRDISNKLVAQDIEIKQYLDNNNSLEQRVKELESIDDFAEQISGWSSDDDEL